MKCYATLILASAGCLLNFSRSQAQGRPERPEFEVASIKPGNPDSRLLRTMITPGGNLRAENVTLRTLIEDAYRMKPFQLSGGPRWIDQDKFQVIAKGDESATTDQVWRMLQTLLEDRFRLVLRRETREQTISYLTVKNEPKLSPSKEGTRQGFATTARPDGVNHVAFRATSMAALADMLSRQMGHVVEDRTGLSGAFDFELDATHDENEPNPFVAPWAPSLGQIGFKLEAAKGPVEFFTVERAEKPSEN
jgi:bla regulator protein blaR1